MTAPATRRVTTWGPPRADSQKPSGGPVGPSHSACCGRGGGRSHPPGERRCEHGAFSWGSPFATGPRVLPWAPRSPFPPSWPPKWRAARRVVCKRVSCVLGPPTYEKRGGAICTARRSQERAPTHTHTVSLAGALDPAAYPEAGGGSLRRACACASVHEVPIWSRARSRARAQASAATESLALMRARM